MTETFEQKLRRAFMAVKGVTIPDLPEEIIALNKELTSRYPNTQTMINIIGKNALLTAEVLKTANSPMMRPKTKLITISQAVAVLGTENLKNIVTASALKNIFVGNNAVREVLNNSVDVAFCMAELASSVHGVSPDEAYLCGLFHNCGSFLLCVKNPSAYNDLFFQSLSLPETAIQKEETLFNTDHAAVGVLMAKKWQLSEEITQAIYHHHIKHCQRIHDEKVKLLVALIKVANGIVSETSMGAYIGSELKDSYKDGIDALMIDSDVVKGVRMALQTYATLGTD